MSDPVAWSDESVRTQGTVRWISARWSHPWIFGPWIFAQVDSSRNESDITGRW